MIGETTKSADGIQGMTDKEIIKVLDNNGNGYYTYYSELEGCGCTKKDAMEIKEALRRIMLKLGMDNDNCAPVSIDEKEK